MEKIIIKTYADVANNMDAICDDMKDMANAIEFSYQDSAKFQYDVHYTGLKEKLESLWRLHMLGYFYNEITKKASDE